MKAISLTQPWASLVILGAKHFETRSWRTSYGGPLAIHAAKNMPPAARDLCFREPFASALGISPEVCRGEHAWEPPRHLTCGVPDFWVEAAVAQKKRFPCLKVILLDGHPTAAQLRTGQGKRGNPVSIHNQTCDRLCQEAALDFFRHHQESP